MLKSEILEQEDTSCKSFYAWITGDQFDLTDDEVFQLYNYVRVLHAEIADLQLRGPMCAD